MRAFAVYCLIGAVVAAGAACGSKQEQPAQRAAQQAAQDAAKANQPASGSAQDIAKGMAQFAESMQQMQKGPNGEAFEPVSFRTLYDFFPEVAGWEKSKPKGETMTMPVKFSSAEATYTKGEANIEVKIVDTAMAQMLTMPYQMFMMTGYSRETDEGYEKASKVAGNPGWEKWDSGSKQAEIGVIVAQRFLVTVSGRDVESAQPVKDVVAKMDLGKLAGVK